MARKSEKETVLAHRAAAWLSSLDLKNSEISDILGETSASKVSGWIKAGKAKYELKKLNISPEELTASSEYIYRDLANQCRELGLLSLHVVFTKHSLVESNSASNDTPTDIVEPSDEFSLRATEYFLQMVANRLENKTVHDIVVANCWGRTLLLLVSFLEKLLKEDCFDDPWATNYNQAVAKLIPVIRKKSERFEFIPAWGEPVGFYPANYTDNPGRFSDRASLSSSGLAGKLNLMFRGNVSGHKALRSIPGILPVKELGGDPELLESLRNLYLKFQSYREVFGSNDYDGGVSLKTGLIDHVDGILAAVGPNDKYSAGRTRFRTTEHFNAYGESHKDIEKELSKAAWGDFGGVALPRPGNEADKTIRMCEQHWMGIRERHMKQCADSARIAKEKGAYQLGVIVTAEGAMRAEVIAAALHRGICTRLIIDQSCADELKKQLAVPNKFRIS